MTKTVENLTNSPYEIDLAGGGKCVIPAFGKVENIEPADNLGMFWGSFFVVTDYEPPAPEKKEPEKKEKAKKE